MTDWLESFAAALSGRLDSDRALSPTGSQKNALLKLARDVAHSTERKNAPLATYIVGSYVAQRTNEGVEPEVAIEEAASSARALMEQEE